MVVQLRIWNKELSQQKLLHTKIYTSFEVFFFRIRIFYVRIASLFYCGNWSVCYNSDEKLSAKTIEVQKTLPIQLQNLLLRCCTYIVDIQFFVAGHLEAQLRLNHLNFSPTIVQYIFKITIGIKDYKWFETLVTIGVEYILFNIPNYT